MLEIDGALGEGGGQVLRSCLALSLLTQRPFHLFNIRANRKPKPGLQPQHLQCVRAVATIGSAQVTGDRQGSAEITFTPGSIVPGKYHFRIGTAGSTSLLLHALYLPLALAQADSELILEGGTHVDHAPTFDFLSNTWASWLLKLGLYVDVALLRPGYYPRGGGQIKVTIQPSTGVRPLKADAQVTVTKGHIFSRANGLPEHVAHRQARTAVAGLQKQVNELTTEETTGRDGPGSAIAITLYGQVPTTFTALGARGKPSEAVAKEAVDAAKAWLAPGAPVDPHSADQLLLPLAFAEGKSSYLVSEVTQHLLTNADIIKRFVNRPIEINGPLGAPGLVQVGPKV